MSRAAWLQEQLTTENAVWLSRDRSLLAAKYASMAADPYDWMRGTAGLYLADQGRPIADRAPTAFLNEPDALQVLLLGDPHPENIGVLLVGEGPGPVDEVFVDAPLSVEWVDLDGSTFGPWLVDLRRAALGMMALTTPLPGCEELCRAEAVRSLARGYATELMTLEAGEPGWSASTRTSGEGAIVADLWEESVEEGAERRRLNRETVFEGQERVLVRDQGLDAEGKGHIALTKEEQATVDRLLTRYSGDDAAPAGFRVLDVVRRIGSGVASLPAERYLVLYDRGDVGPHDDQLFQIREVVDPSWLDPTGQTPAYTASVGGLFDDNAQRLVGAPRRLWAAAEGDVRLAGLRDGVRSFKVTSWGSFAQGLDHARILRKWEEADFNAGDTAALGEVLGRAIASAHARAPDPTDASVLPALAADLRSAGDDFVEVLAEELATSALADHASLMTDHSLFLELLETWGPLLGADVVYGD